MDTGLNHFEEIRSLGMRLSVTENADRRGRLVSEVVRNCVAMVLSRRTGGERRAVRMELETLFFERDAIGKLLFPDAIRSVIVECVDGRLNTAEEIDKVLDDHEMDSQRTHDSWVDRENSSWPPDFMRSLTDKPPERTVY